MLPLTDMLRAIANGNTYDQVVCFAGPEPGNGTDIVAGLLSFANSIPNFITKAGVHGKGWSSKDTNPCTWEYVDCSSEMLTLDLSNTALSGASGR